MARKYNPYKRVYYEKVKKAVLEHKKLSVTGASVTVFLLWYLVFAGAITVTWVSGDMHCGLDKQDCIAEIHFCALKDVYIYPNESWNFYTDTPIKDLRFQRSWGSSWRTINLSKPWSTQVKYAVKFAMGQCYEVRYLMTKSPWEEVKWGFGDVDPLFLALSSTEIEDSGVNTKKITFPELSDSYDIGSLSVAQEKEPGDIMNITVKNFYGDVNVKLMEYRNVTTYTNMSYDCNCKDVTILPDPKNMSAGTVITSVCETCYKDNYETELKLVEIDPENFILTNESEIYEVFEGCSDIENTGNGWGCEAWTDVIILGGKIEGATWLNDTRTACKNISISSVASGTLTGFPAYINITNVTGMLANLYDIIFYSKECNVAGGNVLAHEIDSIPGTYAHSHTRIDSLPSTGINISVYYENTSSTNNGENATGVWNDNHAVVFHMDDFNTSMVLDSTSNGFDGTKSAANAPLGTAGKIYNAQKLDGSNDYIEIPDQDKTNTYTFSAWIYIEALLDDKQIYFEDGAGYSWLRAMLDGSLKASTYDSGDNIYTTAAGNLTAYTWHHVVNVVDIPNDLRQFYVDGVLQTNDVTDVDNLGALSPWRLGHSANVINGTMDEVRISTSAMSSDWVNQSYTLMGKQSTHVYFGEEMSMPAADAAPTAALISPADASTGSNVTFNCTCNDDIACINITLWHNASGTMVKNQTKTGSATYLQFDFYKNFAGDHDGETILWTCSVMDSTSQRDFPAANWTVDIVAVSTFAVTLTLNGSAVNTTYELGYPAYIVANITNTTVEVCINITGIGDNINCSAGEVTYNWTVIPTEWRFNDTAIAFNATDNTTFGISIYSNLTKDVTTAWFNITGSTNGTNYPKDIVIDIGDDGDIDVDFMGVLEGSTMVLKEFNDSEGDKNITFTTASSTIVYLQMTRAKNTSSALFTLNGKVLDEGTIEAVYNLSERISGDMTYYDDHVWLLRRIFRPCCGPQYRIGKYTDKLVYTGYEFNVTGLPNALAWNGSFFQVGYPISADVHIYDELGNYYSSYTWSLDGSNNFITGMEWNGTHYFASDNPGDVFVYNSSFILVDTINLTTEEVTVDEIEAITVSGEYLWVTNWDEDKVYRFYRNGTTTGLNWQAGNLAQSLTTDGTLIYVGNGSGSADIHDITTYWMDSSPTDVIVNIGNDADIEWEYEGEFNPAAGANTTDDFSVEINNHIMSEDYCVGDVCNIPVLFGSGSAGILRINAINISYNPNPVSLNVTAIERHFRTDNDVPYRVTAQEWGATLFDDVNITYYGAQNYTQVKGYVVAGDGYTSSNTVLGLNVRDSYVIVDYPNNVYWYAFIPENTTAWNVTPFGQNGSRWAMNITTMNYADGVDVSLRLNATPDGCRHLFIATNNDVYNANNMTTARWVPIDDSPYMNSTNFWFWMNLTNCNSTVGWYDDYLFTESCCNTCNKCW